VQPDPYYSYYGAPGFYGYGWCRQEAFGAYTLAGRQVGNWPVSVCRW
jgi:hypothetical protein